MNWFLNQLTQLTEDWSIVKHAPIIFSVLVAVAGIAAYLLMGRYYREVLSGQHKLLGLYREKLAAPTTSRTAYTRLQNDELRAETLTFVGRLRAFNEHWRKRKRRAFESGILEWRMLQPKSYEEEMTISKEHQHRSDGLTALMLKEYYRDYRVEAQLLREALVSRLTEAERPMVPRLCFDSWLSERDLYKVPETLEDLARRIPRNQGKYAKAK